MFDIPLTGALHLAVGHAANQIGGSFDATSSTLSPRRETDRASIHVELCNLLSNAEDAYWDLQLAWRTLAAAQQQMDLADRMGDAADRHVDVGMVTGESNADVKIFKTQAKSTLSLCLADLETKEKTLRKYLGVTDNQRAILRPVTEPLEFSPDIDGNELTTAATAWLVRVKAQFPFAARHLDSWRSDLNLRLKDALKEQQDQDAERQSSAQILELTLESGLDADLRFAFDKVAANVMYQGDLKRSRAEMSFHSASIHSMRKLKQVLFLSGYLPTARGVKIARDN